MSPNRQTDRRTDRPTTVTLAAHARRGLITGLREMHGRQQSLRHLTGSPLKLIHATEVRDSRGFPHQ